MLATWTELSLCLLNRPHWYESNKEHLKSSYRIGTYMRFQMFVFTLHLIRRLMTQCVHIKESTYCKVQVKSSTDRIGKKHLSYNSYLRHTCMTANQVCLSNVTFRSITLRLYTEHVSTYTTSKFSLSSGFSNGLSNWALHF